MNSATAHDLWTVAENTTIQEAYQIECKQHFKDCDQCCLFFERAKIKLSQFYHHVTCEILDLLLQVESHTRLSERVPSQPDALQL